MLPPTQSSRPVVDWRVWLPSRGSALFTLVVTLAALTLARVVGAGTAAATPAATSTSTLPYQGRLTDASGGALTGAYAMTFKLYNTAANGSALWTETWSGGNAVQVTSGLFNVLLGSLTPLPATVFAANTSLFLGLTVGADSEMTPRIQLGSAPYAQQAASVAAGAITTTMLADGAVTLPKLGAGVLLGVNGWERDESVTTAAVQTYQTDLQIQHGYAQHRVTAGEVSATYFDHVVTFPTPYQAGTVPTVVISLAGESAGAVDVAKGATANGVGTTMGRVFGITNTGFIIRGTGASADRRLGFYWLALGQP